MPPRRLHLIRHADAVPPSRAASSRLRPLRPHGHRQAERLAARLAGEQLDRILSSPALRCRQTVEPLAQAQRRDVEELDDLFEGSDPRDTLQALEALTDEAVAACTHGDLVPALLDLLRQDGVELDREGGWPTASTWLVEGDGTRFLRATYLPPP